MMQVRKPSSHFDKDNNHVEMMKDTYRALRGNISYGGPGFKPGDPNNTATGLVIDNIDGAWGKIADTGPADTEFVINHNLLSVPVGFHVVRQNKAGSFYDSGTAWTKTQIFLKCNVANVAATFFVF